ncbi:MAG: K(+)-transporting ATPase subunit F [Deltaproteobacteria bacterium]|nr:K(+)-transporting ATPase subunit F [Deltaproteobacteria bacterium]
MSAPVADCRRKTVAMDDIFGALVSLFLVGYLLYALVRPERF